MLRFLLRLAKGIDWTNEKVGTVVRWLILVAVLVSSGNATVRYLFSTSSNAWLELQWYLFAAVFLLCAPYTHLCNEHIRIDLFLHGRSQRSLAWLDILGGVFFLLPVTLLILWLSWPMVVDSYVRQEVSADAGGLLRWPAKLLIPLGFALLSLQGLSEVIKRVAFLAGAAPYPVAGVGSQEIGELMLNVDPEAKR